MGLVCFGLPGELLKYEETAGRPRNDEDAVGRQWHHWYEDMRFRSQCTAVSRRLRHCEAVVNMEFSRLLPAEARHCEAVLDVEFKWLLPAEARHCEAELDVEFKWLLPAEAT